MNYTEARMAVIRELSAWKGDYVVESAGFQDAADYLVPYGMVEKEKEPLNLPAAFVHKRTGRVRMVPPLPLLDRIAEMRPAG